MNSGLMKVLMTPTFAQVKRLSFVVQGYGHIFIDCVSLDTTILLDDACNTLFLVGQALDWNVYHAMLEQNPNTASYNIAVVLL